MAGFLVNWGDLREDFDSRIFTFVYAFEESFTTGCSLIKDNGTIFQHGGGQN